MPIQPQQKRKQQQQHNPHHFHPKTVAFAAPQPPPHPQQQLLTPLSDDDEAAMGAGTHAKRKASSLPWQRMKWTGAMVRLLIKAVYYVGDECASDAATSSGDAGGKKAGALVQKKAKWKSVSKAMMEKGFYVSPQQCEDKFNDLNKRYKRVSDILGRGMACGVVENQSLLDHRNAKSKEEVRKLLNSKHLFFREMCAYHNSCGNGAGHHLPQATQQIHNHHLDTSHGTDDDNNPSDDEDEESEQEEGGEQSERMQVTCSTKRLSEEQVQVGNGTTTSAEMAFLRGLEAEMGEVMEGGRRSGWEKKRWMKMRMVKVEEGGLEIEKERLKWVKYCGKREREMERKRLRNEKAKLECGRMVLLLKHKEIEMMGRWAAAAESLPPSVTGC